MQYTNLGSTGMKVSRICLGMMSYGDPNWRPWILSETEARPFVARALELGINFFDTADMYSLGVSEHVTGKLLREMVPRDEVVVATKIFFAFSDKPNMGGLSRKHIISGIDASLKRLGLDYVDLYQIHRWDYDTPIEETMEALNDVVRAGKARYIGASSMFAWQFAKAQHVAEAHGWTKFVSMQNHYNLLYREEEREMLPLCRDTGIGVIPWSPLARGFLSGTRSKEDLQPTRRAKTDEYGLQMYGFGDSDFEIVSRVVKTAKNHGVPPVQIALAWLLHQSPVTAPIVGATKLKHLEETIGAVDVSLSADELAYLAEPYQPHRVLGHS